MRPMTQLIHLIFGSRCPSQMVWIATTGISFSARMRCLVAVGWRWPMGGLTDEAVHGTSVNTAIAVTIRSKRPDKTMMLIGLQNLLKKLAQFTVRVFSFQWVPVSPPSLPVPVTPSAGACGQYATFNRADGSAPHWVVVGVAKASLVGGLVATGIRAYRETSHSYTSTVLAWLEPAAALERSAGSLFLAHKFARGES